MRNRNLPLLLLMVVAISQAVATAAPQTGVFANETIAVAGVDRVYRLGMPKSVDLNKPAALVIAFHGILIDSKDVMPLYTKLDGTAEKHKFILLFPNAIDRSWGIMPDKVTADLAFFDALLAKLSKAYKIDSKRVYVVGMSNGGYFAHLVGKERSETVAAVASHSGTLGLQTLLGVHAKRKFPVLIIHGAKDRVLPVEWARENRDKYRREGHLVKYAEIPELGHSWGTDAEVNETIWKFFADHPLRKK